MKDDNRKCEMCEKGVKIKIKTYYNSTSIRTSFTHSDKGVLFERKWFCNKCWWDIWSYGFS